MKIIYTYTEAIGVLKTSSGYPTATVEIIPDALPATAPTTINNNAQFLMHALEAYAKVITKHGIHRFGKDKIQAIKDLRSLISGLGLADCKYIIEEPEPLVVLKYYALNGTFNRFAEVARYDNNSF